MTREQYIQMTQFLREQPKRIRAVKVANKVLTGIVFLSYPLLLLYLLWKKDPWLARAVIVPLDSFLIVSFLRILIHAQRPYEKFGIAPVLEKDTVGKSFPSRHVFSVFIIGMTFFHQCWGIGLLFMVIGILLGMIRVLGGVHEPRDVIAGAVIGIACGIIGFSI